MRPALRRQISLRPSDSSTYKTKDVDISFLLKQKTLPQRPTICSKNCPRVGMPIHVLGDIKNRITANHRLSHSIAGGNFKNCMGNKENLGVAKNPRVFRTKVSENLEEVDSELPPSKVNTSFINEATKKHCEDVSCDFFEDMEGTCRANKMPVTSYKRKSDLHGRSRSCVPMHKKSIPPPKVGPRVVTPINKQEGYLQKYSKSLLGSWKQRYCILQGRSFSYYETRNTQKLKCCINFDTVKCVVIPENCENPRKFQIQLLGIEKKLIFRDDNPQNTKEWVLKLQQVISTSRASIHTSLNLVEKHPKFWKYNHLKEHMFQKLAMDGDILLFRGGALMNKMQRLVTGSRFDHVGLLFRDEYGKVCLLEATGVDGVTEMAWDEFVARGWHSEYEAVVFRHVKYKRDCKSAQKLQEFIQTVVGMKYKFNPLKMIQNETPAKTVEKLAAREGFFCSELVANAYIYMGLLPEKSSGSHYLPVHFTTDKVLDWQNGAVMGQEYLIDFD